MTSIYGLFISQSLKDNDSCKPRFRPNFSVH